MYNSRKVPPKTWCRICSNTGYFVLPIGDYAQAFLCQECNEICPQCEGNRYIMFEEEGYTFAQECPTCRGNKLEHNIRMFNDAKLPSRFANFNAQFGGFDTILPNGVEIGNLKKVLDKLQHWSHNYVPTNRGFLLHGQTGIGKTHLLVSTVRYLTLEKGFSVKFVEYSHLLNDLREAFDTPHANPSKIISDLLSSEVLAIDEIGKGRDSAWQQEIIDSLISRSYNTRKTVIGTTNLRINEPTQEQLEQRKNARDFEYFATLGHLRQFVGPRVFSRLYEMMEFISVEGDDFRREHYGPRRS